MKINIIGSDAERRAGLKTLLRRLARQAQFNDVRDWRQARIVHKRGKPDMVVIDWTPSMRLFDLHSLLEDVAGVPVAVVIDHPSAAQVFTLVGAGVTGIIPRTLNPILVLRAFDMVMIGGHYIPANIIDPDLGRDVLPQRTFAQAPRSKAIRMDLKLSPRQEQIMRCVHMGSTNKMIAKTLGISEGTVKIHLASVFQQLGATNRAAAVAIYNGVQSEHLSILRSDSQRAADEQAEHETMSDDVTPSAVTSGDVAQSVLALDVEASPSLAASEETPYSAPATGDTHIALTASGEPSEEALQTGASADEEPSSDATIIVEAETTNVIPLRPGDVKYPSFTDNAFPPLPMAAQPESPF